MQSVPHNEAFEKALIVGLLSDTSLIPRISSSLEPDDFFKQAHREIYKAIIDLDVDKVDSLTVQEKLPNRTKDYFSKLVAESDSILPSLTNIMVYAETIKDKSKLRAGIDLGRDIASLCYTPNAEADLIVKQLEDMFANFLQKRVQENRHESSKEAFKEFMANLDNRLEIEGVTTGFEAIDMILHRLEGLIVLAARPGTGKTALAINIARNVAETKPVVFFSLEQTQEQIFERMLASESEVPLEEIRTAAWMGDEASEKKISQASKRLAKIMDRIHVDERAGVPTSYITSIARQKRFEWGEIGLIIIDYLHIIKLPDKNIVEALGDVTKELRGLGKELGCPVILISQLSRQTAESNLTQNKPNRRPELTDLRSSGEIEQSADIVMFLYRESYYNNMDLPEDIIEIIVKKNRNGRLGMANMKWFPRYVKFKDV